LAVLKVNTVENLNELALGWTFSLFGGLQTESLQVFDQTTFFEAEQVAGVG